MKCKPASIIKIILAVVLTGGVTGQTGAQVIVQSQSLHEFSVKQAVDYAMKNSVQVKNAMVDTRIQQQTNREITASAYPQINGSVNVQDYLKLPTQLLPGEFFGQPAGTYVPVTFGTKWNGTYGANLRQILFDGQVFVGLQARKTSIDYAESNAGITKELIKSNVYKIYYQLVVGKKQIALLDANIARSEKLLHDTKALYENGFQEKLDVDKVNVTLSNLRTQKITIENQLQVGYIALKQLMGMPVKENLVLTDSLDDANLKAGILDEPVKYEDRIEFQFLQNVEKLNRFDIKRHQYTYIPTISLTGSYTRLAQRNKFNFFKGGEPWFPTAYIGLQIDIPIFDGFARDARIKTARLNLEKTQNNLANLKNQIDMEVDSSKLSIQNSLIMLDEQRKNMKLAEEVYNQTKIKYEQGLGSNLEVTNAETELRTAQNNYFSALYDAIVARVDYLKAIGKLE
jgi:outer membrane protein TolC